MEAVIPTIPMDGTDAQRPKQTEVGPVPRDWQILQLADAVDYIDYGISAPIPKTAPPGGVKIVSTADITRNGQILYGNIRRLVAPARTVQRLTLKHGDVLFNWRNSSELIGKSAVFEEQAEPHVFASFILRIRCDEIRSHNMFLCYLMNYYREQGVFIRLSRRAVNQANYNRNEISVLPIPLPPLAEQRQIARVLAAAQRAIERQERLIALIAELKKALMYKLFTEGTRGEPLKQTEIGPVPKSWVVERFDGRFEAKLGKMLSQKAHSGEHARPYLRNKNIQWGRVDLDDLLEMDFDERERKRFELRIGDLLVCEGGEPGRAAIWAGAPFECYYQKALHRVRPLNETATNQYLLCWLTYAIGTRNLYGTAGASSTIAHLPVAQLSALPVPFPSRGEQDVIAEAVAAVARVEDSRMAIKSSLGALFRTLLHQLMTAQIRVHDLDLSALDEPAAELVEVK